MLISSEVTYRNVGPLLGESAHAGRLAARRDRSRTHRCPYAEGSYAGARVGERETPGDAAGAVNPYSSRAVS